MSIDDLSGYYKKLRNFHFIFRTAFGTKTSVNSTIYEHVKEEEDAFPSQS